MRTIVLVDGNPLMWRAAFGKAESYIAEGIVTFFFDIIKKFEGCDALLFWDKGESRWRSDFYPAYKENRQAQKGEIDLDELAEQKKSARKTLSYFGVRDIVVSGVEADDLIAWFSEYFYDHYDRIVIASRDHDLWQLVNDKIVMYDPHTRVIQDYNFIIDQLGLEPKLIVDYKSLVGDVSDNIKGVKGVGPKTAMSLIKQYGGIGNILKPENHKELRKKVATNRILNSKEDLDLAYKLVKCPSLQEMSYFLNSLEVLKLKEELSKEVAIDSFKAMIELDVIGNINRVHPAYLTGLENHMVGFGMHLDVESTEMPVSLSHVDSMLSSCNKCPLRNPLKSPEYSKGNTKANIMVLTSSVMSESEITKLNNLLEDTLGIPYKACWVASACRCATERPLAYGEVLACSLYTYSEIGILKPKMIISIGDEAMSLVSYYKSGSSRRSGEIVFNESLDSYVAILPSMRGSNLVDWDFGVSKIKEFIETKRKI